MDAKSTHILRLIEQEAEFIQSLLGHDKHLDQAIVETLFYYERATMLCDEIESLEKEAAKLQSNIQELKKACTRVVNAETDLFTFSLKI